MAKVVFLGLWRYGHVLPSLPLVQSLCGQNEDLIYYTTPPFSELVEASGARFRPYRLTNYEHLDSQTGKVSFGSAAAGFEEFFDSHLQEIRNERPDYIVHDFLMPGSLLSHALGIPGVRLFPIFAPTNAPTTTPGQVPATSASTASQFYSFSDSMEEGRSSFQRMRSKHGIRPLLAIANYRPLNIVLTSRYLQPHSELLDHSYVFVGQTFPEPANTPRSTSPGDPPRLYITLGTIPASDAEGFLRICFKALGSLDVQVVLSLGGTRADAIAQAVPSNFTLRDFIPEDEELEIIRQATAVVSRAGFSTLHKTLFFGVPSVVVPHLPEQATNARRAAELGAALHLNQAEITIATLRSSIERMCSDPTFRRNSEHIATTLVSAGGMPLAVKRILEHTQGAVAVGQHGLRAREISG